MKYILIALVFIVASCNTDNNTDSVEADTDTVTSEQTGMTYEDSVAEGYLYDQSMDHETMYMVVSGTGSDYYLLRTLMFNIYQETGISIDTLGRHFDTTKQEIILPEDDEDELYAGDYIFRRYGDDFLSIEYLYSYTEEGADDNTMIIVAGIFDEEKNADSVASMINAKNFQTYVLKTEMYVGCMH